MADKLLDLDGLTKFKEECDAAYGGGGGGGTTKTDVTVTIASSGWSNGVYSFETNYPSSSYDIIDIVPIDSTTTDAMKSAWAAANCYGYNETNIIKAKGTVPSIDLTMKMILLSK